MGKLTHNVYCRVGVGRRTVKQFECAKRDECLLYVYTAASDSGKKKKNKIRRSY